MRFLTPLQRKITKSGLNLSPFKTILSSDLSIIPQNMKLGYMRITVASLFSIFLCDDIKFSVRDFFKDLSKAAYSSLRDHFKGGKNLTLYLGAFNTRHYQNAYDSSLIYSFYHHLIEVPKTIFSNNYDRKHFLVI